MLSTITEVIPGKYRKTPTINIYDRKYTSSDCTHTDTLSGTRGEDEIHLVSLMGPFGKLNSEYKAWGVVT